MATDPEVLPPEAPRVTVRDLVRTMALEIRGGDGNGEELLPSRGRYLLGRLSALISNCNDEIRQADAAYALVLLEHLNGTEAANRAKIRAETTPEYHRKRQARDTKELVVELIRSLKYILRSQDEEMRLGGHNS